MFLKEAFLVLRESEDDETPQRAFCASEEAHREPAESVVYFQSGMLLHSLYKLREVRASKITKEYFLFDIAKSLDFGRIRVFDEAKYNVFYTLILQLILIERNGGYFMKLYLDPGHGGSDPGEQGNGLKEKDINLDIALKIRTILIDNYENVNVKMSRTKDTARSLNQRTSEANAW